MIQPLYILDGYSLIYRSYFAFINRPLYNPEGKNSSAVFGFFRAFLSFYKQYFPEYFVVALDSIGPTFRHEMYPEYKANREKAPDDLHAQIPVIEEILDALGIKKIRYNGVEADDIMATIAKKCGYQGRPCFLLTGDKDLLQLVHGPVKILLPEKSSYTELGRQEVFYKFGVYPEQVLDFLSLTGDSSDNIPGVRGIGPKTAAALLVKYSDLSGIYGHIDELTKGQQLKLMEGKESAFLSKDLVQLKFDVPVGNVPEDYKITELNGKAAAPIFVREGMKSLVEELGGEELFPEGPDNAEIKGRIEYELVTDPHVFEQWIAKAEEVKYFAFDCETTGLDVLTARPVGFSLSTASGSACYIPLSAPDVTCISEIELKKGFTRLLTNPDLCCVGQNIKYDYQICRKWGVEIKNIGFDTMIAAWLLDSNGSYGMDSLAERYLGYKTIKFSEVVPKGATFDQVPIEPALEYAAEDADITFRLYEIFRDQLTEKKLDSLFYDLEVPLIPIIAEMELAGIGVDRTVLEVYSEEIRIALEKVEKEVYTLCGEVFNINSTKQLQEILFGKRQLQPVKKIKTGYSTDNFVLEELSKEDPVPGLVLRHRAYSKLKSTYVDALPRLIHPNTGRIHTSYIQTGTATGRLSSRDPNLQNIPIKTEEGRRIRSAFIPKPGHVFISADYSQIELVVLTHLSEDHVLCEAFKHGEDIHRQTASLIFDVSLDDVAPDQRRVAKVINFGIMYGMSGFRLSRELSIPRQKADEFIDSYFKKYSGVREFIDATVKDAEETGHSHTLFGRSRLIHGINSRNKTEKMGAERIAVNTPIQGTAADIVKKAMITLMEIMPQNHPDAKMLLQVHDELIFEVPEADADACAETVRNIMESVVELRVPLKVGIDTGTSWGELH